MTFRFHHAFVLPQKGRSEAHIKCPFRFAMNRWFRYVENLVAAFNSVNVCQKWCENFLVNGHSARWFQIAPPKHESVKVNRDPFIHQFLAKPSIIDRFVCSVIPINHHLFRVRKPPHFDVVFFLHPLQNIVANLFKVHDSRTLVQLEFRNDIYGHFCDDSERSKRNECGAETF